MGTQEDLQQAPIEGMVLTEAEVEAFAAESLESNLNEKGSGEAGVSENAAKASFQEMWQREKESALRKEAERKRSVGNESEVSEGRGQENSQGDEEKMEAGSKVEQVDRSGEWSEEEGEHSKMRRMGC